MITLDFALSDAASITGLTKRDAATLQKYLAGNFALNNNAPIHNDRYEFLMDVFFDAWHGRMVICGVKLWGPKRPRKQKVQTVTVEPLYFAKMVEVIEARLAAATPEQASTWADDEVIACDEYTENETAPSADDCWVDDLDLTGCEDDSGSNDDCVLSTGWFASAPSPARSPARERMSTRSRLARVASLFTLFI